MSAFTLYTYGYQGGRLADLQAYAAAGALIVDTRLNPYSPNPVWRRGSLQAVLGARYLWVQALGNLNYKSGGPIEIADPATGLPIVEHALRQGPVVLLCACADWSACHRRVVAELVQAALPGLDVRHLRGGDGLSEVDGEAA